MLSFACYSTKQFTPPEILELPAGDLNEYPDWPEIIDACPDLSLNESFAVYQTAVNFEGHPAGSLIVLADGRFYVQMPELEGIFLAPKDDDVCFNLTASAANCEMCPLHKDRALIVDGVGRVNAPLMLVAEAPGREEDLAGTPFVGQSGKLLRAYLSELGLREQDYFMTNSVRCRPPGNRDPSGGELDACRHWLDEEIQRVKPKAILALGKIAAAQLARLHVEKRGIRYFQAYHPAYLLRNPGKREEWKRQLQEAVQFSVVGHMPVAAAPFVVEPAAHNWERGDPDPGADVLAIDTETVSLEESHADQLVTVQISDGCRAQLYTPVHSLAASPGPLRLRVHQVPGQAGEGPPAGVLPEMEPLAAGGRQPHLPPERLHELAAHPRRDESREPGTLSRPEDGADCEYALDPHSRRYVYHNVKYDLPKLGGDLRKLDTWEDTALIAYVLRYPRVGLKELGPQLTGLLMLAIKHILERTEEVRKQPKNGTEKVSYKVVKQNFAEALAREPERATEYALLDAVVTARMFPILWRELAQSPRQMQYYQRFEKPTVAVVYDMEQAGALIDDQALSLLEANLRLSQKAEAITAQLWLGDINLNSSKQLVPALEALGAQFRDKTPKGEWQTDKPALLKLCGVEKPEELGDTDLDCTVRHLLNYRAASKLLSTYIPALQRRDADGRVHTSFNQMVTATNRFSSSDPNLQNIPARSAIGQQFRRCFIARPGHVIVKADFSQLELRIYAHFTHEQILMDAYCGSEERDIHQLFADRWRVPRKIAKNGVFGLVYGVKGKKLAQTLQIPDSEIPGFIEEMQREMPSIAGGWQSHIAGVLAAFGYVETEYGWREYYPEFRSPIRSEQAKALREAANLPIQGTAGGVLKKLLIAYDAWRLERGAYDSLPILMVHDELVFEVPARYATSFAKELTQLGADIGDLSVPLKLEVQIGPNWADTQDYREYRDAV